MKNKKSIKQQWNNVITQAKELFIELFLGVRAGVEVSKRRRFRLLSAFLLLMTLVTFIGAFTIRAFSFNTSFVMFGTSGALLISYFISRTRFAPVATRLAIILPAIPPSAVVFFKPEAINLTAELMWVALPLLIASLMMSLTKAIIVAALYIVYVIILGVVGSFGVETFAPLIAYLIVIAFFVITITDVRSQDQSEIEHQLQERRQAEKALRESEEKFSKIFHGSSQLIAVSRSDTNTYIDVNDSYVKTTGYSREELIGHRIDEINMFDPPEQQQEVNRLIKENADINGKEFTFRMKSGEIRSWICSSDIIHINNITCSVATATDITERLKIENALKESEEKFHSIVEHGNDGIVFLQDGLIQYCNSKMLKMGNYAEADLVGKPFINFVAPEYRKIIADNYKQRVAGLKVPERTDMDVLRKDGSKVNAEVSANLIIFKGKPVDIAIVRDVTERKQMEQELRESEEKFFKAFRAIPEAVSVATMKDGVFIEINDSFVSLNEYTREEIIGHSAKELNIWVNPKDHYRFKQLIDNFGHFEHEEFLLRRKSGETRIVSMSVDIINIGGNPCILTIANDITERKQAEEKLKLTVNSLQHSTAQLHATNKELESFSYSVSHDLRSPLRSIDGFSQALLEDYTDKLDDKGKDYLTRVRNASQKMGELIDGLLKLSRLTRSELHREKVDLGVLAKDIFDRLKETDPKRRVKFILGNDLVTNGDPELVRVLLENLLGNAWKFTARISNAEIELGKQVNGSQKTFFIRDNGAGFDMAFKDKLFGAYQRLHDVTVFPGTGIGLATVQRIINRHGGTISADGKVGQGATFYFNLDGEV